MGIRAPIRSLPIASIASRTSIASMAVLAACTGAPFLLAQAGGEPRPAEQFEPVESAASTPDFQAYVFWAYGFVCVFLLLFTVWTALENRKLAQRVEYLRERFERAHPDA